MKNIRGPALLDSRITTLFPCLFALLAKTSLSEIHSQDFVNDFCCTHDMWMYYCAEKRVQTSRYLPHSLESDHPFLSGCYIVLREYLH